MLSQRPGDPLLNPTPSGVAMRGDWRVGPWMTLANVAWLGAGAAILAAEWTLIVRAVMTLT